MADRCNSCPAEVLWLVHEKTGKRAPIDFEPSADGNILINKDTTTYTVVSEAADREALAGQLRTSHFVTCPQGPAWKGRRRG